jgi:hypothetical protein
MQTRLSGIIKCIEVETVRSNINCGTSKHMGKTSGFLGHIILKTERLATLSRRVELRIQYHRINLVDLEMVIMLKLGILTSVLPECYCFQRHHRSIIHDHGAENSRKMNINQHFMIFTEEYLTKN